MLASLESLTKVHPFLGVAVIPFKAVLTLELKRRENDRRILVLVTQMTDMMSHLSALPQQQVGATAKSQLEEVLEMVRVSAHRIGQAKSRTCNVQSIMVF